MIPGLTGNEVRLMSTLPNATHFPFGHAWSCGDTWDRPTSTDPAVVDCTHCRTQMACFPNGERPAYAPDPRGEMLARRVQTSIENGDWSAMLTAAKALYAHHGSPSRTEFEAGLTTLDVLEPDIADALRRIARRLAEADDAYERGFQEGLARAHAVPPKGHGIYSTAVGEGATVVMCECGWTAERATLADARLAHRAHVAVSA